MYTKWGRTTSGGGWVGGRDADDDNLSEQKMYKNLKTRTIVSSIYSNGRMTHVWQSVLTVASMLYTHYTMRFARGIATDT